MSKTQFLEFCVLILVYFTQRIQGAEEAIELQLYNDIFSNYSTPLRPIRASGGDVTKQLTVAIKFGIQQLEALNEKDQQLITHGFMRIIWTDEVISWDPANYANASYIIVPAEDIWLPEITPINSVIGSTEIAAKKDESRVRVYYDGRIIWFPAMTMKTTCSIDVTDFPYDTQECRINYANWMYTIDLLNYTVHPDVEIPQLQSNIEWTLTGTSTDFYTLTDADGTFTFPVISLILNLKRSPRFFELNVLLPAMLLSALLIPMFMLPVESGEKISLGVTIMLAYSIFLLMMNDVTPRTGTIPNLSIAILVCTMFSGMAILINVLIINIHHHTPYKPVPLLLKKIILGKLAFILCCMKFWDENEVEACNINSEHDKVLEKVGKVHQNENNKIDSDSTKYKSWQLMDSDMVESIKDDWSKIARVLDRLFMIIYTVFFLSFVLAVLILKFQYN